jgi:hypothetical protein
MPKMMKSGQMLPEAPNKAVNPKRLGWVFSRVSLRAVMSRALPV